MGGNGDKFLCPCSSVVQAESTVKPQLTKQPVSIILLLPYVKEVIISEQRPIVCWERTFRS